MRRHGGRGGSCPKSALHCNGAGNTSTCAATATHLAGVQRAQPCAVIGSHKAASRPPVPGNTIIIRASSVRTPFRPQVPDDQWAREARVLLKDLQNGQNTPVMTVSASVSPSDSSPSLSTSSCRSRSFCFCNVPGE